MNADVGQISRKVVDERFASGATAKNDMLASFIKHGLTASEVETEITISLYVASLTYLAHTCI